MLGMDSTLITIIGTLVSIVTIIGVLNTLMRVQLKAQDTRYDTKFGDIETELSVLRTEMREGFARLDAKIDTKADQTKIDRLEAKVDDGTTGPLNSLWRLEI